MNPAAAAGRVMLLQKKAFGPLQTPVPVIGQGTWRMGEDPRNAEAEIAALQYGIELGLTHIDTAEMYGDAERIVAQAIRGRREDVFLVSKVLPHNASFDGTLRACERSLERLETDYLDLYLLHWRGSIPLAETMRALETLVDRGLIRAFGVSNFVVDDLIEAQAVLRHHPLCCNQVLYYLGDRTIENRVLPYCQEHNIAVVGYSPFGQGDFPNVDDAQGRILAEIGAAMNQSPRQVALAYLTRHPNAFTIPKASTPEHVAENAGVHNWSFTVEMLEKIDHAFPRPPQDQPINIW